MTENVAKIESLDLTIEDLFKDFYSVPDFQREYVWERKEVEKLLQDVLDEFYDEEGALIKDTEYLLGSVVVCNDPGTYALIDGQQQSAQQEDERSHLHDCHGLLLPGSFDHLADIPPASQKVSMIIPQRP